MGTTAGARRINDMGRLIEQVDFTADHLSDGTVMLKMTKPGSAKPQRFKFSANAWASLQSPANLP